MSGQPPRLDAKEFARAAARDLYQMLAAYEGGDITSKRRFGDHVIVSIRLTEPLPQVETRGFCRCGASGLFPAFAGHRCPGAFGRLRAWWNRTDRLHRFPQGWRR